MGKGKDPRRPLVPAAAGAAHCRGAAVAWWGCVTAGPGWPAGRRRPSGRARWPAGAAPCSGAGLGAPRPVPVPDPGLPAPGLLCPGGGGLGGRVCLPGPGQSKSPAGEVIGLFTHRDYNHISLALDADLDTLVSYNGGEGIAFPGLNRETVPGLARRAGASLLVYRLPATRHQKQIILRRLGKINQEGSAYNLLGLLFPWPGSPTRCSAPSSSTGCCGWRGSTTSAKTPSRCAPWTLWTWMPRGP